MGIRRTISNFRNKFGEEPDDEEDDDDFDEADEDEEDNEEGEDDEEDESGFGEDIGDGYGEDTVDPLDAQERAETKESNKAQTSPRSVKKQSKSNKSSKLQKLIEKIQGKPNNVIKPKNVILNMEEVNLVKKHLLPQKFKKKLGMHISFKCAKCHSPSLYCSSSMLRQTSRIIMRGYGVYYSYYYCINPTCSWRMQRFPPYIQRANGISYAGGVKCVIDWTSILNDF